MRLYRERDILSKDRKNIVSLIFMFYYLAGLIFYDISYCKYTVLSNKRIIIKYL